MRYEEVMFLRSLLSIAENKFGTIKELRAKIAAHFKKQENFISIRALRVFLNSKEFKSYKRITKLKYDTNSDESKL